MQRFLSQLALRDVAMYTHIIRHPAVLVEKCDCICFHVYGAFIPALIHPFTTGSSAFFKNFSVCCTLLISEFEAQNFGDAMSHDFVAGPAIHLHGGSVPVSKPALVIRGNDRVIDAPDQTAALFSSI